ncbi:MAG: hypothetical protein ACI9MR_001425 [Myxococcota bacterium]|jgi:hypothetical protein
MSALSGARCWGVAAWGFLGALIATEAQAEPDLTWRGQVMADVRVNTDDALSLRRLETTASGRVSGTLSKDIKIVIDARLVFNDFGEFDDFESLSETDAVDPFEIQSDEMYIAFRDVALDGLDLRIGRQQVIWGAADRFHAVSHLNPLDLEDPLAFGAVLGNEMVSLAWRPEFAMGGDEDEGVEPWLDDVAIQLVWVPFFKPASVPRTASRAFTDPAIFRYRANTPLIKDLVNKRDVLERDNGWEFVYDPRVTRPERKLGNSMVGARISGRLLDVDLGFSWFYGFDDLPRAEKIVANTDMIPRVDVDLQLTFPRVHVLGVDAATSLEFLDGMGLWTELGVTIHDDLYRVVSTGPAIGVNAIEAEYPANAFVKAVVGIDYTPWHWLYLNVQYLHGFVDEFGSESELDDYIVAGGDLKLDHDRVLLRFFNIVSITDGSWVVFPKLVFRPWDSADLAVGALVFSSAANGFSANKKFGSPVNGHSTIFFQATASL